MTALLGIGLSAVALASEGDVGLRTEWLYHGTGRPIIVDVVPPAGAERVELVLLDPDGNFHTNAISVEAGSIDLAETLPDVWRLRRAGYLQMIADDAPSGSALVVQPMLSRLVPLAVEEKNPSGRRYTHIVGWIHELEVAGASGAPDGESGSSDSPTLPGPPIGGGDPWLANQKPGPRVFSGLAIERERDVVLHTTAGDVRLAMRPDHAPNTVTNFLRLCEGGFYRDVAFHRVVPMTTQGDPFVIQAGDPTATGDGGPGWWLPLEPSTLAHDFGVISMARDVPPDSAGSQFFICLSRAGTSRLDGDYCAFGYAVEGAETILRIGATRLADPASGRPIDAPRIVSTELVPAPPRRPARGRPDARVERPPDDPPAGEPEPARVPR